MTYTAFEIHKDLTEREGFDPQTDEYYAEVDKRIRLEFPHKFDKRNHKRRNRRRMLLLLIVLIHDKTEKL